MHASKNNVRPLVLPWLDDFELFLRYHVKSFIDQKQRVPRQRNVITHSNSQAVANVRNLSGCCSHELLAGVLEINKMPFEWTGSNSKALAEWYHTWL